MAEEQRFQEGHRLCANNCGFFGSPATLNLCSKCYHDHRLKEEQQQQVQAAVAVEKPVLLPSDASASSSSAVGASEAKVPSALSASPPPAAAAAAPEEGVEKKDGRKKTAAEGPNRCASCRKRVGLTGFRCRCGSTFCGTHRYAEQHGCTFDFKAAGRAAIALANPIVKAEKLQKI